jgi:hypothetical protein
VSFYSNGLAALFRGRKLQCLVYRYTWVQPTEEFHRTYFLKNTDCTNAKGSDYRSTDLRSSMLPSSRLPAMGVCMLTRKQSHRKKVTSLAVLQSNTVLIKELSILKIYTYTLYSNLSKISSCFVEYHPP